MLVSSKHHLPVLCLFFPGLVSKTESSNWKVKAQLWFAEKKKFEKNKWINKTNLILALRHYVKEYFNWKLWWLFPRSKNTFHAVISYLCIVSFLWFCFISVFVLLYFLSASVILFFFIFVLCLTSQKCFVLFCRFYSVLFSLQFIIS